MGKKRIIDVGGKPRLDAIGFENKGTDPDLWLEVPEGVDVGAYQSDDGITDAIGASFERDRRGSRWRAFLVLVCEGDDEREARDAVIQRASTVADELLGWTDADADDDDDDDDDDGGGGDDDGPGELPPAPGERLLAGARTAVDVAKKVLDVIPASRPPGRRK
jgi:hypothetical protein